MDCLVTKYKASVQNENLERLGMICVELAPAANPIRFIFRGFVKQTLVGSAVFTDSTGAQNNGQTFTNAEYDSYVKNVANGDKLFIESKYDLTKFITGEVSGVRGIKEYSTINLSYCSSITGIDISKYATNVNLDLDKFTEENHVIERIRYHFNPLLVGNVETIVENMIAGGRNSGTLLIIADGSSIKLHGNTFMTGTNEQILITFTSATNVTVNAGEQGTGALLASYNGSTWTYNS